MAALTRVRTSACASRSHASTASATGARHASPSATSAAYVSMARTTPPGPSTTTRSPARTPSRAISSRLWRVTLLTTTPPTVTGLSRPTGVSLPVRPTWMSMSRRIVVAFSAGNLCAMAKRGALDVPVVDEMEVHPGTGEQHEDAVDPRERRERSVVRHLGHRQAPEEVAGTRRRRSPEQFVGDTATVAPRHRAGIGATMDESTWISIAYLVPTGVKFGVFAVLPQ